MILLVILLINVAAQADSASWDDYLKEYSDEDLQWISAKCQELLILRGKKEFRLDPGIYVVGDDLPEATYAASLVDNDIHIAAGSFMVWANVDQYMYSVPYFSVTLSTATEIMDIGRIRLTTGNIIVVDSAFMMRLYTGIETVE